MVATRSRRLGAGIAAALAVTMAAGCGSGSSESGAAQGASTGGTLRAAFAGGSTETLNYLQGPTALDYVRARLVHAPLCELDADAEDGVAYGVVSDIQVSKNLTQYTLTVRDGVKFTDGSALTSKDVLYSLQAPTLLKGLPFTQLVARGFDLDQATTPDGSTVVLPALSPIADGRDLICQSMLAIKAGTTEFTTGTPSSGPFTIGAFEAGRSTTLRRNPDYYGQAPTLDAIELVSIADGTARVNALRQGQVDYISGITPAQAQTLDGVEGATVTTSELPYASYLQFTMNTAAEPFDDERVREAFKLAVDRQKILQNVYYGRAFIGNDVPGLGFAHYDDDLGQRTYDPERARKLLQEAGAEDVQVELTAGPELAGMVETATLIVEDLKAIGVRATLKEVAAGELYADYEAYAALPFRAGYTPPASFEPNWAPGVFPDVDALVATARSATSADERLDASHQAQKLLWERGNQLGVMFVPNISAASDGVSGVRELQFPDLARATVSE
ncbi:ABC transporter substrate-binding protein [Kineosporia sp. J2-2]|uniref:ABC transporter substrate-binding protein n=1 Tax=Kineosporia corallincola TaxID=2835133 RepID=A0ABS5TTA2_9ACTN|nr:ABC transporter substrate-binding protein [Kineosporia corallincola]MBT0774010.1 ABC transporter substrate-binding protein [Kineosporia corallincola]